jgi:hypothetical protein
MSIFTNFNCSKRHCHVTEDEPNRSVIDRSRVWVIMATEGDRAAMEGGGNGMRKRKRGEGRKGGKGREEEGRKSQNRGERLNTDETLNAKYSS